MKRGGPLKRKAWMKRGTGHKRSCPVRLSREGAAAVECPHGYDSCPKCDRCTCKRPPVRAVNVDRQARRRAVTDGPQSDYCRGSRCYACKAPPPSDPEHTRTKGAGGTDRDTVPLCRSCHRFRHDHGIAALNARHGVDLVREAARLAAIFYPGG